MQPLPRINSDLKSALLHERRLFSHVQVPIITVSGTYRKELLKKYQVFSQLSSEAVFSRAHFSMAEAIRQQAQQQDLSTHLIDPTNFVATNDWNKIDFTEFVGQLMARHKALKWLKDQIDTKVRNKLPITDAIVPVIKYVSAKVTQPIVSMHYEAGNILAAHGKSIIQVLTDPHVRPQYLDPLPFNNQTNSQINKLTTQPLNQITFAVFDKPTKTDLINIAATLDKKIIPKNIIITGAPVDPRIAKLAKTKPIIHKNQPIHIGITTGGLGTNLDEIKLVVSQFAPLLTTYPERIRLFLYAGTHKDFRDFYESFAAQHNLRVGNLDDTTARIRILYEDSLIDANENLIKYMFPWAHGIITKPSGDMAYEAAAAGCFLLFLEPWGEWEVNIKNRFIKNGVGNDLYASKAHKQFTYLLNHNLLRKAQIKAKQLPSSFRLGARKIVTLQRQLTTPSLL